MDPKTSKWKMKNKKHGHNSWNARQEKDQPKEIGKNKFQVACQQIQESTKRYIATHDIDLQEEEEEEIQDNQSQIIEKILSGYEKSGDINRTQHHLEEAFRSGALICLVCIETIKRNDFVWNCSECFCSFHLHCIQKWGKDSIFIQSQADEENSFPPISGNVKTKKEFKWFCPKCRFEYQRIPQEYKCFCGKQKEPSFDPWLIPHSCGEQCDKKLVPDCGHTCKLLCHPGPCPPCPIMVRHPCYCPKANTQMRRCFSKGWSCNSVCHRLLACNQHRCQDRCHEGQCATCERTSKQKCLCGSATQIRPCADLEWQCEKFCGKRFSCGHHNCEKQCHAGPCGECPMSGERWCPCGKKKYELDCTEATPTCGDTCSKPLSCGVHFCAERCHRGACPSCLQVRVKRCICGSKEKELPCSKTFTCDLKCKRLRDCKKHACNRKCCTGDCPSCEHPCGKTLGCGKHKCESRCHQMRCYPCSITHKISCSCGATSITVPCGREKKTPIPKCNVLCKKKPVCHHSKAEPHNCHVGSCPPCKFECGLKLQCGHICPAKCHDAVPIKIVDNHKPAGPWERVNSPYIEIKKLPCPPCQVPIPNTCFGKHETTGFPCSELRPFSCGRKCGRKLKCSHHTCDKECHVVEGAENDSSEGINCHPCDQMCRQPRPDGCVHKCKLPCHPSSCPKCLEKMRLRCHCGILEIIVECDQWINSNQQTKEKMRSCTSPCNKEIGCGHRCLKQCHSQDCSSPSDCRKKMTVRCPCKRIKKELPCHVANGGQVTVLCDNVCVEKIQEKEKIKEAELLKKKIEEEEIRKKELEEYERFIQGGRRKRKRKTSQLNENVEQGWLSSRLIVIFAVLILSIYYLFY